MCERKTSQRELEKYFKLNDYLKNNTSKAVGKYLEGHLFFKNVYVKKNGKILKPMISVFTLRNWKKKDKLKPKKAQEKINKEQKSIKYNM